MKIAINGSLGSGKTTVAKILAEKLGFSYVSAGVWFREMACEAGLNVVEFGAVAEKDSSIDDKIDNRLKELNGSDQDLIIDSRMAAFFIKDTVKVRLLVSENVGAMRILKDELRRDTESFETIDHALEGYRRRSESERKRYMEKYGIDIENDGGYDILVDTTDLTQNEVVDEILKKLNISRM